MTAAPHVRPYTPADLDAVLAIFFSAVRRVARRDYSEAQVRAWAPDAPDRARWAARRGDRPTWIAEVGGAPAGFTDLEADGHIDMMFVHADHQGRGVAGALLDEVERAAQAQGLAALHAHVSLTARPFFARRGFAVVRPNRATIRGVDLDNFLMAKALS